MGNRFPSGYAQCVLAHMLCSSADWVESECAVGSMGPLCRCRASRWVVFRVGLIVLSMCFVSLRHSRSLSAGDVSGFHREAPRTAGTSWRPNKGRLICIDAAETHVECRPPFAHPDGSYGSSQMCVHSKPRSSPATEIVQTRICTVYRSRSSEVYGLQ